MRRLLINRWRGQLHHAVVIEMIRRKIRGTIVSDKTVLVDVEGTDIIGKQAAQLLDGWSDREVKFCGSVHTLPYPLPGNVVIGVGESSRGATTDHRLNGSKPN
jgi:hypothetical protein